MRKTRQSFSDAAPIPKPVVSSPGPVAGDGTWAAIKSCRCSLGQRLASVCFALYLSGVMLAPLSAVYAQTASLKSKAEQLARYGKLPLQFEVNHGQAGRQIQFLARGQGYSFFLSSTEAVIALRQPGFETASATGKARPRDSLKMAAQVIQMQFAGANRQARMTGLQELPGKVNYFLGDDETKWQRGISTFARVRYEQLYSGIDLVCYGNQRQLEYDFILAPGADPAAISLHFDGLERLEIDSEGDLILRAGSAKVRQHKPVIYQTIQGARKEIAGGYRLLDDHTAGFDVASHDPDQALVIDPILSYSTYLGGKSDDIGWGIAVDSDGNAYVAGETLSLLTSLVTPGAFQRTYGGGLMDRTNQVGGDAFVAKMDPTGSALVYLTYLGGSGDDSANAIALDSQRNACLTGFTDSINFPTKNPIQTHIHGSPDSFFGFYPLDAFVAQLDSTGSQLLYSTYLGGAREDEGIAIAVDAADKLYVTGFSSSLDFPTTTNALQRELNNGVQGFNDDAFVSKIDPTQTGSNSLVYSTYIGTPGVDRGFGIAVDAGGNAYVTGIMDLLGRRDGLGTTLFDTFVVKLDPTGSSLVYGQLLHGAGNDVPFGIAVDAAGSAYVVGSTDSGDFPATPNDLNQGGVFKSTDGGGNWSLSSAGLTRKFIRSLAIDPTVPSTLYAGTSGGVFKSVDGGGNWFNSANALEYIVITNAITVSNLITINNGISVTNVVYTTNILGDAITFWLNSPNALGFHLVTSIAVDPTDPTRLYAGTFGGGLFSSSDLVAFSVTNVQANITNAEALWFPIVPTNRVFPNPNINVVALDPLSPATIYAGTAGGIFRSTNGGGAWRSLVNLFVKSMALAPDASIFYAGTRGGVYRSANHGANWLVANTGLANFSVNALVLDPANPKTVYAGTGHGIFKSINAGTNWVSVTNGLTALIINALAIDPATPSTIYAGTINGLFKSVDAGSSWNVMTNGLTTRNVVSLAIDPGSPGTVYAGTGVTNSFGGTDCFVSKLTSDGATLSYSTILGGKGQEQAWNLALDAFNNAYVVGVTTSTNFPVIRANAPSQMQTTNSGGSDAFVLELNSTGSALIYSFYLGGRGEDLGYGIGLDPAGNAYVTGRSSSLNFPTVGPIQPAFSGGANDAFVTKILAQPALQIARTGNSLVLSWPAPSPEFILQVNHNGMQLQDWTMVPQTPEILRGRNTVTLSITSGHQTFRLQRQ